jgi:hypothetical protein
MGHVFNGCAVHGLISSFSALSTFYVNVNILPEELTLPGAKRHRASRHGPGAIVTISGAQDGFDRAEDAGVEQSMMTQSLRVRQSVILADTFCLPCLVIICPVLRGGVQWVSSNVF